MSFRKTEKTRPLIKIVFFLGEDQWHGYKTESVWADKIEDDRCRIRNTPFYANGVSFEDVVFIKAEYGDFAGTPGVFQTRPDGVKQVYFQDPDEYWIEVNSAQYD